jgi:putative NIF3 family GTP cyclohydrolase 1 type 2
MDTRPRTLLDTLTMKQEDIPLGHVTAGEVIARIKNQVGVPWREQTVDTIKGGSSDTVVTGIATTFLATLDVLQKSVAAGRNLVITHEPTFWNNLDKSEGLTEDPLYRHKQNFIRDNALVVWRFHDHWHARRPDGISEGFYAELGWNQYQFDESHGVFELPQAITLDAFAKDIKSRLKSDNIRVVGPPRLPVKTVCRGSNKLPGSVAHLSIADAFVIMEADRENDLVEWCRDTMLSGQKKGFVFISHNRGEESGMDNCAKWLRTFVPEVPVEFIPSGDPFWRTT